MLAGAASAQTVGAQTAEAQTAEAQTAEAQTADAPGYTLHAAAQTVLTDVTIADRSGNPIRGLKASDLRLYDDDRLQRLTSFEEHGPVDQGSPAASPAAPAAKAGVYSNRDLQHLAPVLTVILLDLNNLEVAEQGYLAFQINQFLDQAPSGNPIALYARRGNAAVLLQPFTADRALLHTAVAKAIPRFPPSGREHYFDLDTLQEIGVALLQVPGRKNILWFSGGSALLDDELKDARNEDEKTRAFRRQVYDELAANRIAIYPVDARGLIGIGTGVAEAKLPLQHRTMEIVAEDTGGHAFYNGNDLSGFATRMVESGAEFYTLSYTPRDFHPDHTWHTIRVELAGNACCLSYRRGYFAGGEPPPRPAAPDAIRIAGGSGNVQEPNPRSLPLVFEARVEPTSAPAKRGVHTYAIHFSIPADALTLQSIDHRQRAVLGVATVAHNREGAVIDEHVHQITLTPNPEKLAANSHTSLPFDEQIDLRKGDNYLRLTIWDMTSGRLGALEIPIVIPESRAH